MKKGHTIEFDKRVAEISDGVMKRWVALCRRRKISKADMSALELVVMLWLNGDNVGAFGAAWWGKHSHQNLKGAFACLCGYSPKKATKTADFLKTGNKSLIATLHTVHNANGDDMAKRMAIPCHSNGGKRKDKQKLLKDRKVMCPVWKRGECGVTVCRHSGPHVCNT